MINQLGEMFGEEQDTHKRPNRTNRTEQTEQTERSEQPKRTNRKTNLKRRSYTMTQIAEIITEFVQLVDNDKDYQLKELKQMLADVYKTKTAKKKTPKVAKTADKNDTSSDSDEDKPKKKRGRPAKVSDKPKREPSAYNKYVKERMEQIKTEQPAVPAKDRMKMAAADWKNLTKEEQEAYKA
jgi:hypothetical protein